MRCSAISGASCSRIAPAQRAAAQHDGLLAQQPCRERVLPVCLVGIGHARHARASRPRRAKSSRRAIDDQAREHRLELPQRTPRQAWRSRAERQRGLARHRSRIDAQVGRRRCPARSPIQCGPARRCATARGSSRRRGFDARPEVVDLRQQRRSASRDRGPPPTKYSDERPAPAMTLKACDAARTWAVPLAGLTCPASCGSADSFLLGHAAAGWAYGSFAILFDEM